MPSPGEDIQSWSVVAGDNGTADPLINWAEGQARVGEQFRARYARRATKAKPVNGSIVTTGTPRAQRFYRPDHYHHHSDLLVVKLKIGPGPYRASATLNMDGLGIDHQLANGDVCAADWLRTATPIFSITAQTGFFLCSRFIRNNSGGGASSSVSRFFPLWGHLATFLLLG
jgi:hypothetical protein